MQSAALSLLFASVALVACTSAPPSESGVPGDTPDRPEDTELEDIPPAWPRLAVNELMARNEGALADGSGSFGDWVELWNPETRDVDLEGWTVSDDLDDPAKQVLRDLVVPAGGYLLLWADGDPGEGPDHLDFSLSGGGESFGLYTPDGTLASGLSFGQQAIDHALAREGDGGSRWRIVAGGTPGASNGPPSHDAAEGLAVPPEPCDLQPDLASAWFLEGDSVGFEVACTGALGAAATFSAVGLPESASFEGSTFGWTTGPADGGRVDVVLEVRTSGRADEVPLAETVTFWVADDPSAPDNVPVDPATYAEEWGLPVLHVAPEGDLSQSYVPATVHFLGQARSASIKIRGATSAYYPKPSYTLEFDHGDLDVPEWEARRDHLVLLTTFDDNAYVRQKLIYDQWAAIAAFWETERLTPRTFFVVVYLSGAYHGLYVGLDRIDDEFMEQMGFPRDGNLYKAVNHDANFYLTDATGSAKDTLHDGYEKEEGVPEDDFSDLDAFVSFTGNAASAEEILAGAGEWYDLQEFMDWFLLVWYSAAADSAGKNSYLAAAPGEHRFRYAPWDFNHSWGQDWRTYRVSSSYNNTYTWNNRIFWAIQQVPEGSDALWARFAAMREPGGPFDPDWLRARVEAYYAAVDPSARRDWARWGESYRTYGGWAGYRNTVGDWTDYDGERAYLERWLADRAAFTAPEPSAPPPGPDPG